MYRTTSFVPPFVRPPSTAQPARSARAARCSGRILARSVTSRPIALGLDVTERARILPEHLAALADRAGCAVDGGRTNGGTNEVVRYIADALRFYMEFHSRYDGFYGAFIHDPLALAAALDPTLVRTEAVTVDVELGGRLTTGETVTDWRRVWGRPPNVDMTVEVDSARFMARFIERVGDLAARQAIAR